MPELTARQLTVKFGADPDDPGGGGQSRRMLALDHVDLFIPDGQTMALIGPSGCGKTTLVRALAGLISLDEGSIWFGGREVTDLSPRERDVAVVFQEYALYPHLPSGGIVSLFFRLHRRSGEIPERLVRACEIMGPEFEKLLDRKPGQLSGGEQQRVAIARCIIRDPTVFLFDEPLANLDAALRSRVRTETKRLLRQFATTALYVTHDQREAGAIGDRVALMADGRIVQIGAYADLRERPANTLVAGFMGYPPMNLLPGRVIAGGIEVLGCRLQVASRWLAILAGEPVTVGIHPDELKICSWGEPRLQMRVESAQPQPERRSVLVFGQVGGVDCYAYVPGDSGVVPGDVLPFTCADEKWVLFDQSGQRVG